jgi:hypothetical protein
MACVSALEGPQLRSLALLPWHRIDPEYPVARTKKINIKHIDRKHQDENLP